MDEIKLKPCPFCGSDAELIQGRYQGLDTFYARCWGCGAQTDLEYAEEFAAELWNERVESNGHDRPTCKIILGRELHTAFGKPITGINAYILSCGHQAVGFERPRYCPECGEEVGE